MWMALFYQACAVVVWGKRLALRLHRDIKHPRLEQQAVELAVGSHI